MARHALRVYRVTGPRFYFIGESTLDTVRRRCLWLPPRPQNTTHRKSRCVRFPTRWSCSGRKFTRGLPAFRSVRYRFGGCL